MKPVGTQIVAEFLNCSKTILNDKMAIEQLLREGIEKCGFSLVDINSHSFDPIGVTAIAVVSESHVAIHTYPEALHASVDIYTCSRDKEATTNLLNFFKEKLDPATTRSAEITRGNPIEVTETNWITDNADGIGYDVRYHIEKTLHSGMSKYQQIDIIENEVFGRILFLNNDLQIAEYDATLYNQSLLAPLLETQSSLGSVAILGGGDGGILHELLRHNPGSVTLIDIDSDVVEVAKTHLRGICHDAFEDPRVEVIHDDVYNALDAERRFDAIIYDLTMHPETFINMDHEIYLVELFSKIKNCLHPGGIVAVQCCSEYDRSTITLSEKILKQFFTEVRFYTVNIPSFCSPWVFAAAHDG